MPRSSTHIWWHIIKPTPQESSVLNRPITITLTYAELHDLHYLMEGGNRRDLILLQDGTFGTLLAKLSRAINTARLDS